MTLESGSFAGLESDESGGGGRGMGKEHSDGSFN